MNDVEFQSWVEVSHAMFDFYENRTDMYPVSRRWVDEWLEGPRFNVTDADRSRIEELRGLNFSIVGIDPSLWAEMFSILEPIASGTFADNDSPGFAVAPYLLTWNVQRYADYQRKGIPIKEHFAQLGDYFNANKPKLREYNARHILDSAVEEEEIIDAFQEVLSALTKLGDGKSREAVGTVKLLHIVAPYYFPPIDRKIAQRVWG